MKRIFGLALLGAGLIACNAPRKTAQTPASQVVVVTGTTTAAPLPPPPPDDPLREWHTYSPPIVEGTPFYRVAQLNVSAPSMQGGPCSLAVVGSRTG